MANNRKIQGEIDKLMKKIQEGMEIYDEIAEKVAAANDRTLKERIEGDLKKEIKKLQRHRDSCKSYIANSEVKDKKALEEARRAIERKMEAFKVTERETKTKAFSKEGLIAASRDPNDPKSVTSRWLAEAITDLKEKIETIEFDVENGEGGDELEERLTRAKLHNFRLEQLLRLLNRDEVEAQDVNDIKTDIEEFVENCQDVKWVEQNEELYDMFGLPDEGDEDEDDDDDDDDSDNDSDDDEDNNNNYGSRKTSSAAAVASATTASVAATAPAPKPAAKQAQTQQPASTTATKPAEASVAKKQQQPVTTKEAVAGGPVSPMARQGSQQQIPAETNKPAPKQATPTLASTAQAPPSKQQQPAGKTTSSPASLNNVKSPASPPNTTNNNNSKNTPSSLAAGGGYNNKFQSEPSEAMQSRGGSMKEFASNDMLLNNNNAGGNDLLNDDTAGLLEGEDDEFNDDTFGDDAMEAVSSGATLGDLAAMSQQNATLSPSSANKNNNNNKNSISSAAAPAAGGSVWKKQPPPLATTATGNNNNNNQQQTAAQPALPGLDGNNSKTIKAGSAWSQPLSSLVGGAVGPKLDTKSPSLSEMFGGPSAPPSFQQQQQSSAGGSSSSSTVNTLTPSKASVISVIPPDPAVVMAAPAQTNVSQQQQLPPPASKSQQQQQATNVSQQQSSASSSAASTTNVQQQPQPQLSALATLKMLDMSVKNLPQPSDVERLKPYVPANPQQTASYYPQKIPACFSNPELFQKFEPDTLFFIFYYQQGTYQHYLAAKELKRNSYRFHKKFTTWFQRHDRPKSLNEEQEQGTYVYFDFESGWCQRIKNDFAFRYTYLENELV